MIDGITVIGDVLRPDGSGRLGGVDRPTVWMFDAVKRQTNLASGLPVDVITANGIPDLRQWLSGRCSATEAHLYWARGYEAPYPELAAILAPRLRHRFCVGYELPPWLRALMHAMAVPFIVGAGANP